MSGPTALLVLDLTGTFAFALNGALTAPAAAVCFLIRVIGLRLGLDAPKPPGAGRGDSAA